MISGDCWGCQDPDFAAEYIKATLEDEDERESLYRGLSVHGNPRLSTLVAVTKAIGLKLAAEMAQ